jgi:hypothetical protein
VNEIEFMENSTLRYVEPHRCVRLEVEVSPVCFRTARTMIGANLGGAPWPKSRQLERPRAADSSARLRFSRRLGFQSPIRHNTSVANARREEVEAQPRESEHEVREAAALAESSFAEWQESQRARLAQQQASSVDELAAENACCSVRPSVGRSGHCHRYARLAVSVPPRPSSLPTD